MISDQPCKTKGCRNGVVGSSITGEGHVRAPCNSCEWGKALISRPERYLQQLGARCLA